MNLQERIAFIMKRHIPASVKRKHLSHLMLNLGDYSEDADELGQAYDRICEALEQLDNERVEQNEFKQFEKWLKGNQTPIAPKPLTVTELDRTLEFFLTYNILSMQQVQDIRAKAAAYLR